MRCFRNAQTQDSGTLSKRATNRSLGSMWKAAGLVLLTALLAVAFVACDADEGEPEATPTSSQEPPISTSTPNGPTSTVVAPSTRTPLLSDLSVTVSSPRDGDSVTVGISVRGESQGVAVGQVPDTPPPWIYVLVRPIPGDPNQSWWVQPYPLVSGDGTWDAFVFVGLETDVRGTPYDLCAIISNDRLAVDRFGGEPPPALARDCIRVTR